MLRRVSSSALIGRTAELSELQEAVAAAARERPSLTVVSGEAGVGKSRLLRELAREVRPDGAVAVLWGECVPLGDGELPYGPIIAALRDLARGPEAPLLEAVPRELRHEIARLVPELDARPGREEREVAASEYSQGRLYERLLAAMRHFSRETVVVAVLEDLQWADAATRDFLAFVVRNLRDERVAFIASYRSDELDSRHPLRGLLGELIRRDLVGRLEVGRLTRADTERQVEAIIGRPPDARLAEEVFARSQGNPFLAEELLVAHEQHGAGAVPESLRDALLLRVEQLAPAALGVVRAMAALARPVNEALIGAATGLPEPGVRAGLRDAIAAHVLVAHPVQGTYSFRHSLVRELLYGDLLPGERVGIHTRVAQALEGSAQADPGELAYHWHAAANAPAALEASVLAGLAAARVYAFSQALSHFERALELWDQVAETGREQPFDRVDVLHEAAQAARLTGDYARAIELSRQALDRVDAAADPLRAAALHECLGTSQFWEDDAGLESLRAALALLPERCVAERARLIGAEGRALGHLFRWQEARERCEVALRLALEAGSPAEEARARTTLGVALAFRGDPEAGEPHLRTALRIAERENRPDDHARAYVNLAEALRLRGDFAAALELMLEGSALAARLGMHGSVGAFMAVNAAEDLFRLGRWDEADERLRATARLDLRLAAAILQQTVSAQLAVARGAHDGARSNLERVLELCRDGVSAEYVPGVYGASTELALWQRRPEDACADIARALELVEGHEDPLYTPLLHSLGARAEADAAEAARARGDGAARGVHEASAEALLARLDDLLDRHSLRRAPPDGLAHRAGARAELARLRRERAPELWSAAASAWDAVAAPYPAAYARWRQAEALLEADGDRREAATVLAHADDVARALRATPLLAAVGSLARAARLDVAPEAPEAAATALPAGLTSREVEVVRLLAEGLTNRQIANRLFISERTAGVHVSHILSKLDARNRVVAANIANRLGLLGPPPAS